MTDDEHLDIQRKIRLLSKVTIANGATASEEDNAKEKINIFRDKLRPKKEKKTEDTEWWNKTFGNADLDFPPSYPLNWDY